MKAERYTLTQFDRQFPNDAACLDYIFDQRNPEGGFCAKCGRTDTFYRVEARRCYSCANCGHQIHPCEGTIFHKSSTSLRTWFLAMFLMTASKNGVSAKELERQLGVTYKTAWRMGHQIRKLMNNGGNLFSGTVEADETYIGGKSKNMHAKERRERITGCGPKDKVAVIGVLERGGDVRATVTSNVLASTICGHIVDNVAEGSHVITDELRAYNHVSHLGFTHSRISHSEGEYVRAEVHTNSIEGFWGQLKRSINGTFHSVSRQHLQGYVNEFSFRYNRRASVTEAPIFPTLVSRSGEKRD